MFGLCRLEVAEYVLLLFLLTMLDANIMMSDYPICVSIRNHLINKGKSYDSCFTVNNNQ